MLAPMVNHQLADLPAHLSERVRVRADGTNENGHFVLYWMRTTVQADENPALEVAIRMPDSPRRGRLHPRAVTAECPAPDHAATPPFPLNR